MRTIIRRPHKLEERIPLEVETGAKERLLARLSAMNRPLVASGAFPEPVAIGEITNLIRARLSRSAPEIATDGGYQVASWPHWVRALSAKRYWLDGRKIQGSRCAQSTWISPAQRNPLV